MRFAAQTKDSHRVLLFYSVPIQIGLPLYKWLGSFIRRVPALTERLVEPEEKRCNVELSSSPESFQVDSSERWKVLR